jgi:hypothetical protein
MFPHQNPEYTSPRPIRATRPAHLILLCWNTRKILGDQCRSQLTPQTIKLTHQTRHSHSAPTTHNVCTLRLSAALRRHLEICELCNWDWLNSVECNKYTGWSESLCAPDDYCKKFKCIRTILTQLMILKMAVTEYIRNADRAILNTVFENTVRRVNECLETGGGQFEHYL